MDDRSFDKVMLFFVSLVVGAATGILLHNGWLQISVALVIIFLVGLLISNYLYHGTAERIVGCVLYLIPAAIMYAVLACNF
mgnify:CR=1 FL=1